MFAVCDKSGNGKCTCSEKVQTVEGPPVGNSAALQGHTETVGVKSGQTLKKLYFSHNVNRISLTISSVFLTHCQSYFSHNLNCISLPMSISHTLSLNVWGGSARCYGDSW